jgi:hypothetical protein
VPSRAEPLAGHVAGYAASRRPFDRPFGRPFDHPFDSFYFELREQWCEPLSLAPRQHAGLAHAMPCCAVLRYATRCHAALCCAMPCCAMLRRHRYAKRLWMLLKRALLPPHLAVLRNDGGGARPLCAADLDTAWAAASTIAMPCGAVLCLCYASAMPMHMPMLCLCYAMSVLC